MSRKHCHVMLFRKFFFFCSLLLNRNMCVFRIKTIKVSRKITLRHTFYYSVRHTHAWTRHSRRKRMRFKRCVRRFVILTGGVVVVILLLLLQLLASVNIVIYRLWTPKVSNDCDELNGFCTHHHHHHRYFTWTCLFAFYCFAENILWYRLILSN